MTVSHTPLASLALAALALLCACDKPKPRAVADLGGPLGASGATTVTPPPPVSVAWATGLMNRALKEVFPNPTVKCLGHADVVDMRYGAPQAGVRVAGWGWDPQAKAAVGRIVLVDGGGLVVGAGETGVARPDVSAAVKDITSPTTGWRAFTSRTSGRIEAIGILGDGKSTCSLGRIRL